MILHTKLWLNKYITIYNIFSNLSNLSNFYLPNMSWTTVMSKKDKKMMLIKKERIDSHQKAMEEISNHLTIIKRMKKDIRIKENKMLKKFGFLPIKTFINRLTRGGRGVGKSCYEARERVDEIERLIKKDHYNVHNIYTTPLIIDLSHSKYALNPNNIL